MPLKTRPQSQSFGKVSSKNIFARVPRSDGKSEKDFGEIMEKCAQRLKTDANYKKKDYDLDYIRYKILKLQPEKMNKTKISDENDSIFSENDEHFALEMDNFNFATQDSRTQFFR